MKGRIVLVSGLILSLVSVCCIGQESMTLEDRVWKLDSYVNDAGNLVNLLPDTEITAQFSGGVVGGSAGCNSYSAEYEVHGSAITIGHSRMTLMYCYPEEVMNQEQDYISALQEATNYKIKGNTLEMTNADGKVILVFTAA